MLAQRRRARRARSAARAHLDRDGRCAGSTRGATSVSVCRPAGKRHLARRLWPCASVPALARPRRPGTARRRSSVPGGPAGSSVDAERPGGAGRARHLAAARSRRGVNAEPVLRRRVELDRRAGVTPRRPRPSHARDRPADRAARCSPRRWRDLRRRGAAGEHRACAGAPAARGHAAACRGGRRRLASTAVARHRHTVRRPRRGKRSRPAPTGDPRPAAAPQRGLRPRARSRPAPAALGSGRRACGARRRHQRRRFRRASCVGGGLEGGVQLGEIVRAAACGRPLRGAAARAWRRAARGAPPASPAWRSDSSRSRRRLSSTRPSFSSRRETAERLQRRPRRAATVPARLSVGEHARPARRRAAGAARSAARGPWPARAPRSPAGAPARPQLDLGQRPAARRARSCRGSRWRPRPAKGRRPASSS